MKKQRHHLLKTLVTMLLVVTMVLSTAVTAMAAPGGRWGRGWNWGSWGSSAAETAEEEEPAVESEPEAAVEEAAEEPAAEEEAAAEEAEAEEPAAEEEAEEPAAEEEVIETEEAEEPAAEEETEEEIPEITYPAQDLETSDGKLTVKVQAPEGALPEGAKLQIEKVDADDYQSDIEDVAGEGVKIALAVDITFLTADGEPIEPNGDVKVTMSAPEIEEIENPEIVHIPDEGSAEKIGQADEDSADDEVVFESGEFSVYAVVGDTPGTQTPYRATYEFYNADGSKYYFKDAANKDQYTQILKDGEVLDDVGIPAGASQNAKFVGWFDEDGNKVEIGQPQSVTANKTIKLTAKLQGVINVFFVTAVMKDDQGHDMERSVVTIKQVEYTVGQTEAITVNTSDVTTEAPTSEQAVVGWNRDESAANEGTVEGTNGVITLYANGNVSPIKDVTMFPAIQNAYWLYFDENDGGTGGGASYTAPQFVTVGGKPTKPADPHRTGYTFGGWYKDAACTQAFDFNAVMTATTTVYAKWNGATTTYTIIVKVQSTSDSAKITSSSNLAHDAKTYDFWKAYPVTNVQTGGTASVAQQYKNLASEIDSHGHIKYETCDPDTTIAADGSTVLYVYYERDVMTIHWKHGSNQSDFAVWYGLYDASFTESGKTWIEPRDGYQWRINSTTGMTFKDAFNGFPNDGTTLTLYEQTQQSSYYDIFFYIENIDGTWKLDHTFEFTANSFTFTEKYDAFTLYQYSRNGSSWSTATANTSVSRNNQNLYIRFRRKSYNIEYHNGTVGTEGTIVRTDSLKYEAPLDSHENPTVSYPVASDAGHYDFIGWFADSGWKTMVTFTELDEKTKTNYRDWYGITDFVVISKMPSRNFPLYAGYSLKGWDCALDPNGGEFTNASQAGVFWLQYGKTFSSDIKTNISREGYVFQGWMVANVTGDLNVVTRNGLRYVGDDSNWTMTEEPWEFSTGIEGRTYLMAKWFYKTSMHVVYDANGGTYPPKDEGAYSDGATTVAFSSPVAPAGSNFLGWDIVGTDTVEKLQPGATFTVSSDYATDGTVTLKAVYSSFDPDYEVPVSHLTWYANGGQNTNAAGTAGDIVNGAETLTNINLQLNADIVIPSASTFKRTGYKFIGWARVNEPTGAFNGETQTVDESKYSAVESPAIWLKLNDDGTSYTEYDGDGPMAGHDNITKVAVDEVKPYQAVYAVWSQVFYVVTSHDAVVTQYAVSDYSGSNPFDITKEVASGYLYGGYYNTYVSYGQDSTAVKETSSGSAVSGMPTYDGSSLKSGSMKFWVKANAFTADGSKIVPTAGAIYYLKEVPVSFLTSRLTYVYDEAENDELTQLYLLTAVDDNNYQKVQFHVETQNKDYKARLATSFSVTQRRINKTYKTTASDFGLTRAYIGNSAADDLMVEDTTFTMTPQWITMDGKTVSGTSRTFRFDSLTKDGIKEV